MDSKIHRANRGRYADLDEQDSEKISLKLIRAAGEVGLNLCRTDLPIQQEAKAACWYGEKERHMKRPLRSGEMAIRVTVQCFEENGYGDIMNHSEQLASELVRFLINDRMVCVIAEK